MFYCITLCLLCIIDTKLSLEAACNSIYRNLEKKAEYDKSIKVLNKDRGNIVDTNSWTPLFRKVNMVRHANAMK